MRSNISVLIVLGIAFFTGSCGVLRDNGAQAPAARALRGPEIWQNDIAAFTSADAADFPPVNSVLFIGSSSVRMWDLEKYFPGLSVINRGFGGSYLSDSVYYAGRIAVPYKPRLIVLYAGDNDIADNKPPARLASDLEDFLAAVRKQLPQVPVIYISIKPSPARWRLWPEIQQANGLIKASCQRQALCRFLDVGAVMLGADGKPKAELFMPDGLHMNDKGYRLWTDILTPLLKEP
jgi:lysophospholipase L1-like esterase